MLQLPLSDTFYQGRASVAHGIAIRCMMMMMIDSKPYPSSSFLRSICSRVYSSVEVGVGNHRHPTGDRKEKTTFVRIAFASRLTPRLAFVLILVIWGSPSSLWLCMVYKVQAPNGGRRGWLVASPLSPPIFQKPTDAYSAWLCSSFAARLLPR